MRHLIGATLIVVASFACHDGTMAQSKQAAAVTPADLDGLLAPVALYPDQLLAQMLLCAAEPAKVVALHTWLQSNTALKGTELQDAATVEGFDPNFVAMTLFPDVVKFMAEQLDWTTQLGTSFAADRSAAFASIQRLRKNAYAKGTLKTTPQQEVETKTTSAGEQVIVIEPANPQIVYVPQYNPQVVYTQPPATTVVIEQDDDDAEAIAAGLIGFTAGIAIGAAIDNDYYYGPWGWHGGGYMYNDAWDDWYDAREDAREDWVDHRQELVEERGERVGEAREERTERVGDAREQRTERAGDARAQRTERAEGRQDTRTERTTGRQEARTSSQAQRQPRRTDAQAGTQPRTAGTSGYEARGHSDGARQTSVDRSGTRSDAFSGYSSGRSTRAASARGQSSRGSNRGGGGGGRRR
jgi:hypothetical protein